jgi:hypothetical protein
MCKRRGFTRKYAGRAKHAERNLWKSADQHNPFLTARKKIGKNTRKTPFFSGYRLTEICGSGNMVLLKLIGGYKLLLFCVSDTVKVCNLVRKVPPPLK